MLVTHFFSLDPVPTRGQGNQLVMNGGLSRKNSSLVQLTGPGWEQGQGREQEPGWEPQGLTLSLTSSCSAQVHGSRLRLPQVTPADSGEYVCRVVSNSGTQEASVLVTIQQRLGPSHREYLRGHNKQWGGH